MLQWCNDKPTTVSRHTETLMTQKQHIPLTLKYSLTRGEMYPEKKVLEVLIDSVVICVFISSFEIISK